MCADVDLCPWNIPISGLWPIDNLPEIEKFCSPCNDKHLYFCLGVSALNMTQCPTGIAYILAVLHEHFTKPYRTIIDNDF